MSGTNNDEGRVFGFVQRQMMVQTISSRHGPVPKVDDSRIKQCDNIIHREHGT